MALIKVEDDKTLARDSTTGAILATDKESLATYRKNKSKRISENNRLVSLEKEVSELKLLLNSLLTSKE